jgi:hypothetical protein
LSSSGINDVTAPYGIAAPRWVCEHAQRRTAVSEIVTDGLDQAKNVFVGFGASLIEVHEADASGRGVVQEAEAGSGSRFLQVHHACTCAWHQLCRESLLHLRDPKVAQGFDRAFG